MSLYTCFATFFDFTVAGCPDALLDLPILYIYDINNNEYI